MSRIGLQPVLVPKGVVVTIKGNTLHVKGQKGELLQDFEPVISFDIVADKVLVSRINDIKRVKSMHGLYRSLLNNMVLGVSQGHAKTLIINGVGYRAEIKGKSLFLNIGYSMPIEYILPDGIQVEVGEGSKIMIRGIDKCLVGQTASEIRALRPPEPYKGKGVRYDNENVRRKVGKSGVK